MKTLFYSSSVSPRRPLGLGWLAKGLAACAVTACALHAPYAAAAGHACTQGNIRADSGWNILQDFAGLANGVTVGSIDFSQAVTSSGMAAGYQVRVNTLAPGMTGGVMKLDTFPGLGMKWRFLGYEPDNTAATASPLPAVGTYIQQSSLFINATFPNAGAVKNFRLKWRFELVVTDMKVYAGGVGNFSNESNLKNWSVVPIVVDNPQTVLQACTNTNAQFAPALSSGGAIALPELPKPPTPTCQFPVGNINQGVALNLGTTGAVPAIGAGRSEGSASETRFQINALNCGLNSNYALYFTDVNDPSVLKDFVKGTSGSLAGKVNLRIFSDSSGASPVSIGPKPVGGSMPSYNPGATNSGTAAGSSFVHPFYVQYVRAPGVTGPLTAGTLGAQANITVVYP